MRRGMWYAAAAYFVWGLLPIYWKWLQQVSAGQLLSHRIVWSFLLLAGVLLITRQLRSFRDKAFTWRNLRSYAIAAGLISVNWLTYIWAVNSGFIVETSLGYYINPLVSVLLGVIFLQERLRPLQWVALGVATAGVLYLGVTHGSFPWVSLTLAFSFALYSLVKKTAPLGSVNGLLLETAILLLPALAYLLYKESRAEAAFLHQGVLTDALLIGSGLATMIPLLLFASAAQRIPMLWIGLLQYIAPTMQFLLAVFVYAEPLTRERLIGFSLVWVALIVFAVEGLARRLAPGWRHTDTPGQ